MIELKNINKIFGKGTNSEHIALKNINLTIEKGDFIVVIGGNGAGKSTLLNAISGNFPIDTGDIFIDEKNITKLESYSRARYISRVFQDPLQGTAPRMTILENLSLALRKSKRRTLSMGVKKKDEQFILDKIRNLNMGLENRLNTEIGLLSGGQRQVLSLLMATITHPRLLLLDEHTSALDPKMQKKVMELTKSYIEVNNITTIMITHNLDDALKYGNRLLLLSRGEIVYDIKNKEKEKLDIFQLYEMISNIN